MDENRIEVIIPIPDYDLNYGVHATTHATAARITIRINAEWRAKVAEAIKLLDISEADFIRTSTLNMAKAILQRQKEKNSADPSIRSG